MANGSGLGLIPVLRIRKEDEVSGLGAQALKGGWNMQACCAHPGFSGAQEASWCDARRLLFTLSICVS